MSKKKVTQDEIAALTEEKKPVSLGGNLIERARTAAFLNSPSSLQPLLNELAGEVERLWQVESHLSVVEADAIEARLRYSNRVACLEAERDAELARVKSEVDVTAIATAFNSGYKAAAMHTVPIINKLLFQMTHGDHEH